MACRGNKLRRPSRNAMARRCRQVISRCNTASASSKLGSSPLTTAFATDGNELGLVSGSQHTDARVNNLIHVESCLNRTQGLA
jgi:hypothetical protein